MKGDFSRDTFSPRKHYSAVLMQQGRVQLDADWNEQRAIDRHRIETEARDLIGPSGGQTGNAGFEIGVSNRETLSIGPGTLYVGGILCENEEPVLFEDQRDLPGAKAIDLLEGDMEVGLVYLDVWEQHVTGLEDESIREVALGGPDTATRRRTVWQAKVVPLEADTSDIPALQPLLEEHVEIASQPGGGSAREAQLARINSSILEVLGVDCDGPFDELQLANPPSTGRLLARALPPTGDETPCVIAPGAGYERLENQLYRVEIHDGGENGATFKWSRDNGSVVTGVLGVTPIGTGSEIEVRDLGRDETLGFAVGQYVELVDDSRELFNAQPGPLAQITDVDPTSRIVTVDTQLPNVAPQEHPKLRRWDSAGALSVVGSGNQGFVELEGGIEVRFTGGHYNTGDYWLIPARTATGGIEWPENVVQSSVGVRHHYAQLALVMVATVAGQEQSTAGNERVSRAATGGDSPPILPASRQRQLLMLADCRRMYPPVTELTSLYYLSGDGQEAGSGQQLPRPLVVGVANGNKPVVGARVRFAVQSGGHLKADDKPDVGGAVIATTDARGEARCVWTLATGQASQQVEASLVDGTHLSVYFNANLSATDEAVAQNIQITKLLLGQPGPQEQELRLDSRVSVTSLNAGIQIVCDSNSVIDEQTVVGKPTCFVTLDMPFPQNSADRTLWGTNLLGFQPLILAGQAQVSSDGRRIIWTPTQATSTWLLNNLFQATPPVPAELTAHLTLKGNFIWDKNRPQAYLDGDVFGRRSTGAGIELGLPSGDGRRGGDFEMWFRLVAQALVLDSVTLTQGEIVGGSTQLVTGTVRLAAGTTAPGGGQPISLQSSDAAVLLQAANATTAPAQSITLTIPGGQSSADFHVTTQPVASTRPTTITATLTPQQGSPQVRTVNFVVQPPTLASVSLNPAEIVGKTGTVQGTVTLNGRAPTSGILVQLESTSANAKLRQPSVTIPSGSTSAGFVIDTEAVSSAEAVTIKATAQDVSRTASLTIQPPTLSGLAISPTSVRGGSPSTATLTITGPAPANFTVQLESLTTARATVPASVTVPANSTSTTFTVSSKPVPFDGAATIRATRAGAQMTANVTVLAPDVSGFTFDASVIDGGATTTGRVTLNGPAPFGDSVTLDPPSINTFATYPASVVVALNATQIAFSVTGKSFTGTSNRLVTITATYLGSSLSATLQVRPTKSKEKEKEKEKETIEKISTIEKALPQENIRGEFGIEGPEAAEAESTGAGEESGESDRKEEGSALGGTFVQRAERPALGEQFLDQPPAE